MTNHVHFLVTPGKPESLARAIGYASRDYAHFRNSRLATHVHLWQARYYSCPVDPPGVAPVLAYIERNPVRAGLVRIAEDYRWSSAMAHVTRRQDDLLDLAVWDGEYSPDRWREVLRAGIEEEAMRERLRLATTTGRPFGSEQFVGGLEQQTARRLARSAGGRPKKVLSDNPQTVLYMCG